MYSAHFRQIGDCGDFVVRTHWIVNNGNLVSGWGTTAQLSKVLYSSKLDLASEFWRIQVESKLLEKAALATPHGVFKLWAMLFGLTNAQAVLFQRLIQNVLEDSNPEGSLLLTRVEKSVEVRTQTLCAQPHAITRSYPRITLCSHAKALCTHMCVCLSHHMAPRPFQDRNNARCGMLTSEH